MYLRLYQEEKGEVGLWRQQEPNIATKTPPIRSRAGSGTKNARRQEVTKVRV
jgi:hypothetical protein